VEFIDFFKGLNLFLQFIVVLMLGFYIAFVIFLMNLTYKKNIKRKEEFYKTLFSALNRNSIDSIDDIFNIYKGINDLNLPNDRYRSDLNKLLRSFIVKMHNSVDEKAFDTEMFNKWKVQMTDYIKKNEEVSPFSNLPDAERNIMNDIISYLDVNNPEAVKTKSRELAGYIQSKSERIVDLEKKNRFATIISAVGIILTIIFGILSL
jgi:hypothetical protein